jgi:hypothetical protein
MQAFSRIEKISGGNKIETWTGETGWPTGKLKKKPHTILFPAITKQKETNHIILPNSFHHYL